MKRLPLNFYRIQMAYLMFASVTASFSLFLVWSFTSTGLSSAYLGLVLGLASLAGFLKFIFLSFCGIHSHERILGSGLCVMAIAVVSLPFAFTSGGIFSLAIAAIWLSICGAFVKTASVAVIPQTSPQEHAATAFSHRGAMFSFEPLMGPMLAGAVISLFGGDGYLANAIVFLIVVLALFARSDFGANTTNPENPAEKQYGLNGFTLLWGVKTELWIAVISALFNFAFNPFLILIMPLVVIEKLNLGPFHVGVLDGAFAVGIFVGSSYLVSLANSIIGARFSIFLGGVAISLAIMSVAVIEDYYFLLAVQSLAGVGLALFNVNVTKIRCMATPIRYRTKLESSFMLTCMSTIPVGMWFFGILASNGAWSVSLATSGGCLLVASLLVLAVPYLDSLAKMTSETLDGAYARVYPKLFSVEQFKN